MRLKRILEVIMMFAAVQTFAPLLHAEDFTAKVFRLDSDQKTLLFTLESKETHEGSHAKLEAVHRAVDGSVASMETAELDGGKLVKYALDLKTAGQHGTVEVRDGKVYFSFTSDGKTKTDDESIPEHLIIPPLTSPFIVSGWEQIAKGDTLEARFASAERRETVGFKFFKSAETDATLTVEMKPSSFIIASVVKPGYFIFDKKTRRMIEYRGRIVPKIDGKDVDGDVVYKY